MSLLSRERRAVLTDNQGLKMALECTYSVSTKTKGSLMRLERRPVVSFLIIKAENAGIGMFPDGQLKRNRRL
ncbi:hypothetical protein RLO149_c020190 [Roseobacter litoralis Och 149]|uniref:Uncharacterized protein n=1 Tax=Roseobacter litoralis (strain ATCC 49566 / DSM 6996 / JCM 21268 / NBRC 15278 / OCh 149) TaxID=391595 RepID=F7ZKZ1_ROSLO|nr:hypothetical protein RLO149_c020190 [Roseobacter litoralis Och 149]